MNPDKFKILIVDDEPPNVQVLGRLLSENNYKAGFAVSGKNALELLKHGLYDLVLLDVTMPEMNGFETCRIIRTIDKLKDMPVIFLTANAGPEFVTKGFESGGNDYITKPFNQFELLLRIKTHLELYSGKKMLREYNGLLEKQVSERTKRLKLLSQRLMEVQEEEKHHIARELHDDTAQTIGALKLNLQLIKHNGLDEFSRKKLESGIEIVDQLLNQVKSISLTLHPTVLDDYGFKAAVTWLIDRFNFDKNTEVSVEIEPDDKSLGKIAPPLFRIIQEAVANIRKHSFAQKISVSIRLTDSSLFLVISDNGKGFDVSSAIKKANSGGSLGVISMRERAELIGGKFEITSETGKGTTVTVSAIPLDLY